MPAPTSIRIRATATGRAVGGNRRGPEVAFMHSVLLPNTQRVLYWGYTRADQSRVWDYSTPAGSYLPPANQPADSPGLDANTSDMWSAEHTVLDTAAGTVLIHGGFSPDKSFNFDPGHADVDAGGATRPRIASTRPRLTLADGTRRDAVRADVQVDRDLHARRRAGRHRSPLPAAMNHHQYYPWTYLLPDGRLFIAGPARPDAPLRPRRAGGVPSRSQRSTATAAPAARKAPRCC